MRRITVIGSAEPGNSLAEALEAHTAAYLVSSGSADLSGADRDEDAILIALPADQAQAALKSIGHAIGPETVVLDCCPVKKAAAGWAEQYLKTPENYLGIWPGSGVLFIAADPHSSEQAICFVSALADELKLERIFTDPAELDGILAAVCRLPAVSGTVLLDCLSRRPGWTEGKKAVGEELRRMTEKTAVLCSEDGTETLLTEDRENTVRLLDEYIAGLTDCRNALHSGDEAALRSLIRRSRQAREQLTAGKDQPITAERITAADSMMQAFFGGLIRKKRN